MDYILWIGIAISAWMLLRHFGNERETQLRLIEIRVRREVDEQAILKKIEEERAAQAKVTEVGE